jgi:Spy/CpxP family protein refolding chaperone
MNIKLPVATLVFAAALSACAQTPNPPAADQPRTPAATSQPAPSAAKPMLANEPAMQPVPKRHGEMKEMKGPEFFLPHLVMLHQKCLGLTPDQQKAIKTEMVQFAAHAADLQWQESAERGELDELLNQPKLDEKAILAEQDKLFKIQDDMRLSHLAMLIRIKNALTPEQQQTLMRIQKEMEHHPWGQEMDHPWREGWHEGMERHPWGEGMERHRWGGNEGEGMQPRPHPGFFDGRMIPPNQN